MSLQPVQSTDIQWFNANCGSSDTKVLCNITTEKLEQLKDRYGEWGVGCVILRVLNAKDVTTAQKTDLLGRVDGLFTKHFPRVLIPITLKNEFGNKEIVNVPASLIGRSRWFQDALEGKMPDRGGVSIAEIRRLADCFDPRSPTLLNEQKLRQLAIRDYIGVLKAAYHLCGPEVAKACLRAYGYRPVHAYSEDFKIVARELKKLPPELASWLCERAVATIENRSADRCFASALKTAYINKQKKVDLRHSPVTVAEIENVFRPALPEGTIILH